MGNVVNITDPEIARRLDAGDIEGVAMLAAKQADPRAFLAAMLVVNEYMHKPKGRTMRHRFSLEEKKAKITHYEVDRRASDKPEEVMPPIAVVAFELNLAAEDVLPLFDPTLRNFLFHKNGAVTHDLVAQTNDAPDVRYSHIMYPLKWKAPEHYEGSTIRIHNGIGGPSDTVLNECAVATFHVTPLQGGQVLLEFTARAKEPDLAVHGRLAGMYKSEQTISFDPPEEMEDEPPIVTAGA